MADSQAAPPLRGHAAARGARTGHCPERFALSDGRAALQSRRAPESEDANRGNQARAFAANDGDLRDPRPNRSDDDGASHRHHERRDSATGGSATRRLSDSTQSLCRRVHRHATDEFLRRIELHRDGDGFSVATPSFSIPLDRGVVAPSDMGDEVVLGVRPEHVRLANSDVTPTMEAVVDVVEPLGAHTLVYLRAGAMPLSMLVDGHIELVPGQAVLLTMSHEAVHLFHPVTGTAVYTRALEAAAR